MGEASRSAVLIASPSLQQRCPARLSAALACAVALPSITAAAYQHFGPAACTGKQSAARRPAHRYGSRHRLARSSPESTLHSRTNPWTSSPADAILCPHSWLTRWGAADGTTGLSLRLPRPFHNTPPFYLAFAWTRANTSATELAPLAPTRRGGWGGTPQAEPSSFKTSQRQRSRHADPPSRGLQPRQLACRLPARHAKHATLSATSRRSGAPASHRSKSSLGQFW